MADRSSIEWTDATWNPIRGCTRVSPGCGGPGPHGGCYAEGIAARFSGPGQAYEGLAEMRGGKPRWTGKLAFVESALTLPLRWRQPRRIFVNSMSDLFHEAVPDEWIDRVFAVMALAPRHTFQVLTKRSARMRAYLDDQPRRRRTWNQAAAVIAPALACHFPSAPVTPRHVWLGVSAEDQRRADERVPDLLATPAAVRFVSAEPLLGPVSFEAIRCSNACFPPDYCNACYPDGHEATGTFDALQRGIDWLIVGGESGPGARPMHPAWARLIRDQCMAQGVPYFFKQWGEWAPGECADRSPTRIEQVAWWDFDRWFASSLTPRESADMHADDEPDVFRLGKARAGRVLDGVEHNGMPEVRP